MSGAIETAGSSVLGKDIGELAGLERIGIAVTSDAAAVIAAADAIVDFTVPKASVEFARLAAKLRHRAIIGTTGFDAASEAAIAEAAKKTAIVKAGNMSLGVNLLVALTKQVAAALGNDFDIEIVEMHHRMKVDAPSGTALMLGDAAAVRTQRSRLPTTQFAFAMAIPVRAALATLDLLRFAAAASSATTRSSLREKASASS